jgi:hypothetical protein
MARNPKNKVKSAKQDQPMTGAMKFFLAGCVAELYLVIVRRFYMNGSLKQVVAWDGYLKVLGWLGAAVLVLGAVLALVWKANRKKFVIGSSVAASGLFLFAASFLIRWNMSTLTVISAVVLLAMLLGILWSLYDRECALSLTTLGISLVLLWICRNHGASAYVGLYVKLLAALWIVALVVIALLTRNKKLGKLIPAKADPAPIYAACVISGVALLAALFSSVIAYYAMWALAIVVFGLAVYYTVKQL